jgi:hypothetical protein
VTGAQKSSDIGFDEEGRIAHSRATPFDMDGKAQALRALFVARVAGWPGGRVAGWPGTRSHSIREARSSRIWRVWWCDPTIFATCCRTYPREQEIQAKILTNKHLGYISLYPLLSSSRTLQKFKKT